MGAQNSIPSSPKLTLAEKRYRVNELRRKSTRKRGNVSTNSEISQPVRSFDDFDAALKSDNAPCGKIDERLLTLYSQQFANVQDQNAQSQQRQESIQALHHAISAPTRFGRAASMANGVGYDLANQVLIMRTQRVLIENSWKRCRKGRLKYDPNFRKHASVLTQTLDYIVKNLVYTNKLSQHFQSLGKKHCQMPGRARFQNQYWDAFAEAFTVAVIEGGDAAGHRCRETAAAWRSLIAFIIKQMRRGYDDERKVRKRFSVSLMGAPSRASARAKSVTVDMPSHANTAVAAAAAAALIAAAKKRTSIRNFGEFRVASFSAIPSLSFVTVRGSTASDLDAKVSFSLATSRTPSLTDTAQTSLGTCLRTPSMNSTASTFAAVGAAQNVAANGANAGDELRSSISFLLMLNHQQRSASWCAEQPGGIEHQNYQQHALNALANAMKKQATLSQSPRTVSSDHPAEEPFGKCYEKSLLANESKKAQQPQLLSRLILPVSGGEPRRSISALETTSSEEDKYGTRRVEQRGNSAAQFFGTGALLDTFVDELDEHNDVSVYFKPNMNAYRKQERESEARFNAHARQSHEALSVYITPNLASCPTHKTTKRADNSGEALSNNNNKRTRCLPTPTTRHFSTTSAQFPTSAGFFAVIDEYAPRRVSHYAESEHGGVVDAAAADVARRFFCTTTRAGTIQNRNKEMNFNRHHS